MNSLRNRKTFLRCVAVIVLVMVSAGQAFAGSRREQTLPEPEYWPTHEWRHVSPESVGMDGRRLSEMFNFITVSGNLVDGVIVVKDGYLVVEAYREPLGPGRRHIIHSCTKSIVSAVVGIAINEGHIPGVHTTIGELFPNADTSGWSDAKHAITLEHMLTMTTGLRTRDNYQYAWEGLTAMRRSPNWLDHALSLPSHTTPGRHFEYSNVTSFLLSAAVHEATGESTEVYARRRLFGPLGISDISWPASPQGVTAGWGELRMIPTDLAKFGLMYLHGGRWDGQQIVPEEWVRDSWQMHVRANTLQEGYGYQWWIPEHGVYALGYRGQYLIINPEENLVVVIVSNLPDDQFYFPERLYLDFIVPAVHGPPHPVDQEAIDLYSRAEGAKRDAVLACL